MDWQVIINQGSSNTIVRHFVSVGDCVKILLLIIETLMSASSDCNVGYIWGAGCRGVETIQISVPTQDRGADKHLFWSGTSRLRLRCDEKWLDFALEFIILWCLKVYTIMVDSNHRDRRFWVKTKDPPNNEYMHDLSRQLGVVRMMTQFPRGPGNKSSFYRKITR